jgi:site-specific DNA recombinase
MTRKLLTKAVIYCRVSSTKQTTRGDGLSSQQTRCREFANFRGYEVVKVFSDDMSGSVIGRPGMNDMLKFIRANRKSSLVVIIDDISRLARGLEAHLKLRAEIGRAGAVLESPSIEFGEDSDSQLVEHLLASVSEHQKRKNGEQTLNRMRARLSNGFWVFAPPIGYHYDRAPGGGKMLVRKEPLASILKEGLEGYASDRINSPSEFARFLQSHAEFPRGRHGSVLIERATIILKQVLYTGYVAAPSWGIGLRKGQHEGLISLDVHTRIQEKLEGKVRAPYRVDVNSDFPLRGHVLCDDCGHALTACWSRGRDRLHPYYLCRQRGCESRNRSIARKRIDADFEATLKSLVPTRELFTLASVAFEDSWNGQLAKANTRRTELKRETVEIDKKIALMLDRIVDAESRTVMSAFEKRVDELEGRKLLLEENISKCGKPVRSYDETFRTAMGFLANPWNLYASERLEDKRAALKLTFPNQLRYHRERGFRTPETSLPFRVLSSEFTGIEEMARPAGFEPATARLEGECSIQLS